MEKESVRKDSRKVGSGRLDFTLSRSQKSGLTCCWVTLLPLVQQVPHHHRAGPRSLLPPQAWPVVGWSGHSAVKLGLAEWFTTFLLSTGCLLLTPGCHYRKWLRPETQMHHGRKKCSSCC